MLRILSHNDSKGSLTFKHCNCAVFKKVEKQVAVWLIVHREYGGFGVGVVVLTYRECEVYKVRVLGQEGISIFWVVGLQNVQV